VTPIASRCRLLLTGVATVAAAALLAAPASATVASTPAGCPTTPVTQPFAPWADAADYFLAPDGGFEHGAAGWALRGQAAVTPGNEPFAVNAKSDASSLRLRSGSDATTAPFCIGVEHRTMRFFSNAATSSSLAIDAIVPGLTGTQRTFRIATLGGSGAWAPTAIVPMVVNTLAAQQNNAMNVRLRFTPLGAGTWTIDDVFIDPFRGK
jgi:hypothetical protein